MAIIIAIKHKAEYVHIVSKSPRVDGAFLAELIDTIGSELPDIPHRGYRMLLEVQAPETRIDLITAFEAWRRASEKGLPHTQIAYVIKGRPIHPAAAFIETISKARHIQLRFFEDHQIALDWLCRSAPSGCGRPT